MKTRLGWGILGTGRIARTFAAALADSRTGRPVAVGSRTAEAAGRFAADFGGLRAHGGYDALLTDPEVQAVYIATPHPAHLEWTLRAAAAGKHILCEKPLALNRAGAARMVAAAREHRVFLMEAFMYRCHPQTAGVAGLVRAGAVGRVERIEVSFRLNRPFDPAHRLFNRELGGGGILDLGCYPVSFARLIAGAAMGRPVAEPERFSGEGRLHPVAGTDEVATARAVFPGGITAELACGITGAHEIFARIHGTGGWIDVPAPFAPGKDGNPDWIFVHRNGEEAAQIFYHGAAPLYALEADAVAAGIAAGGLESPAMSHADTLGNMAVLDAWRTAAGVRYADED